MTPSCPNRGYVLCYVRLTGLLFALLCLHSGPTLAYWAPLQDVSAWIENSGGEQRVVYEVFDPESQQWERENSSWYDAIVSFQTADGIVTWVEWVSSAGRSEKRVKYATYHPDSHEWKTDGDTWQEAIVNLQTADGVVAWVNWSSTEQKAEYATFNPAYGAEGRWESQEHSWYRYVDQLQTADGVIAWIAKDYHPSDLESRVCCAIWDAHLGSCGLWRSSDGPWRDSVSSLTIADATITYDDDNGSVTRGYTPGGGNWYNGTTQALAYFMATPTSGYPPLWVWFTDLSIGASSSTWSWNFGDGNSSSTRSPYHTYTTPGYRTVTLGLSGPNGSDSEVTYVDVLGYPLFSVTPTSQNYGQLAVGDTLTHQFSITNSGTGTLDATNQQIIGIDPECFGFTVGGGSLSLPPGQTHQTWVAYHPLDADDHSAVYRITHNASGSPTDVQLQGVGTGIVLSVTLSGSDLTLQWSSVPDASAYWVYGGANSVWFEPGFGPEYASRIATIAPGVMSFVASSAVGDPEQNWTYLVMAVDGSETEMHRSDRAGEADFALP